MLLRQGISLPPPGMHYKRKWRRSWAASRGRAAEQDAGGLPLGMGRGRLSIGRSGGFQFPFPFGVPAVSPSCVLEHFSPRPPPPRRGRDAHEEAGWRFQQWCSMSCFPLVGKAVRGARSGSCNTAADGVEATAPGQLLRYVSLNKKTRS